MPSLAELFGFAPALGPWNSYPTQPEAPEAPQLPPAPPWWLQSLIAPSPQSGLTSPIPRPLDAASFDLDAPSGSILGNFPAVQGATNASPSGGILQALFPNTPPTGGGILGNLTPARRESNAAASGGVLASAFPETTPDANVNAADRLGPASFFLRGTDPPGIFNSPIGSPFAPQSLPSWGEAPRNNRNPPGEGSSWLARSLLSIASPAPKDDSLNSADVAFRPVADFRPGQFSPPGQFSAQALNNATVAPTSAPDAPVDTAPKRESGDSDASFARSYDRAQMAIAADQELRTTVRMAEKVGDKTFNDRLATIMANLEQDPRAALDAIRGEIFSSQIHNRSTASAANAVSALATWKAINRLDALQPKLGIWTAREEGFQPAVKLLLAQQQTFYRIASDPTLSRSEKLDQLAETGLFDTALASSLMAIGGFAYRGGLLAPADRPGGGPSRASPSDLASRSKVELEQAAVPDSGQVFVRSQKSDSPRYKPGIVTGSGTKIEGTWLSGITEAPVPAQVADLLRGRRFRTFDDLREEFWKTVANIPELAVQFTAQNVALMKGGQAPKAPRTHWARDSRVFHLHHVDRVADDGPVYSVDNIWVVSPARHAELHPKGSP